MTAIAFNEVSLLSGSLTMTNAYQDVGYEIPTANVENLGVFLDVDINSSTNFRLQALAKHTLDGSGEYNLIGVGSALTVSEVQPLVYELGTDADQKVFINIPIKKVIPYIQLQAKVDSHVGASALLLNAHIRRS